MPAEQGTTRHDENSCLAAPGLPAVNTDRIETKVDCGDGAILLKRSRYCLSGKGPHA